MTMELVDGRKGEPHIDSTDMGILHQALYGRGSYVLDWGQSLACAMSDANHAVVGTGCGMIQGLCFTVTGAETVQIDSGTQSQQRNDIIAAHYHRDSGTNVESIELKVIKGMATYGTAADPSVPAGTILEGATDAYMPLWRVPISGITPGTPVKLFESLPSLRDSITRNVRVSTFVTQNNGSFEIHGGGGITTGLIPGYLYVSLPGIKVHATVDSFPVLLYSSGPKPSQSIDLGWSWVAAGNAAYMTRCVWNADGSITTQDRISMNDSEVPVQHWVRIPDGVTIG